MGGRFSQMIEMGVVYTKVGVALFTFLFQINKLEGQSGP